MDSVLSMGWTAIAALALTGVGLLGAAWSQLGRDDSRTRRGWARYVVLLDRDVSFLRLEIAAPRFAQIQLAISVALLILALILRNPVPVFLVPLVFGAPLAMLRRARDKRVASMEDQLDGWMMGLANTLRATPALGEAIDYSSKIVGAPLADEFDFLLKERSLGVPLDDALRNTGARIGSRAIGAVLSTLVVGRTTGGSLPEILETSAAQLREMARLDGVIRTKTAEGRSQAWVLALMPFGLLAAIQAVDHDFFEPLLLSITGWIVIAISTGLWAIAVFSAKKILEIDV
ncbi:type II secretion system F family protein [Sandaracinus amylolyticus]|uniref:type II secretion system F family protein n=1 Tax=Sandaracinus amylolyticus TaxID=927083 RepID=UPI001F1BF16D|nr:type II secretion system F family protein [Sandaracinus amylolyticus]UJR82145.1 Flp pilus assembly protein TadB [Sandaracinus amylolyticus]